VSVSSRGVRVLIAIASAALLMSVAPALGSAAAGGKKGAPSLNVLGFGINQLFVAKGTTVKSPSMCDAIVGSDSPIGPPQQVYLTVFVRANGVPKKAATQIKDTLPYGYDEVSSPTFTPPTAFSNVFGVGAFAVGSPSTSAKGLYYEPIVSFNAEAGKYEGPSANEFDGEYAYTVQAKFGGRTLRSSATVKVDC
jgi:hypothetical protein